MRSLTTEGLIDLVPTVRSREQLESEFRGLDRDAIAQQLISRAITASGRVGIGGGMLAAGEYFAPPTWLGVPVQISAETAAVSLVEIKLTGELHSLYGLVTQGSLKDRATLWVSAWAKGSAVTVHDSVDLRAALTKFGQSQVKRQLARRARRNLLTLFPMMTGAAIARWANRKQTREFARAMLASVKQAANA